jgi:uncharacterized membrane protein YgcG
MSRGALRGLAPALVLLLFAFAGLASVAAEDDPPDPGPRPGAMGAPPLPLDQKRLYDVANVLDNAQEAQIESEATRLARHGMPSLIIVQAGAIPVADAEAFAADTRRAWAVESAPGADDGLVVVVTVDPDAENGASAVLSWGDNALPHFGVNRETAGEIQRAWLDPYLASAQYFEGIDYSLRRIIYHTIYDPAPQAALSGARATLDTVVTWVAPVIAVGGIALAAMAWRPSDGARRDVLDAIVRWATPAAAAIIAVLAVWTRSGLGAMAALLLLAIAVTAWVRRDPANAPVTEVRATVPTGRWAP